MESWRHARHDKPGVLGTVCVAYKEDYYDFSSSVGLVYLLHGMDCHPVQNIGPRDKRGKTDWTWIRQREWCTGLDQLVKEQNDLDCDGLG